MTRFAPMAAGVQAGVQAALLLARGRADGLHLLAGSDTAATAATATRSFWAAVICLPAFICLYLIDTARDPPAPHRAHMLALQLLGYVLDWAAFAVITHEMAARLNRQRQWPVFIAAWNWCNVVQYVMAVLASLPPLLGLPGVVGQTTWLVATGWALWLEWYATRLSLQVPAAVAVGLVLIDQSVGLLVLIAIQSLQH